jgi:hypothetical protein
MQILLITVKKLSQLTRVVLGKLRVAQIIKVFSVLVETYGSLPRSHKLAAASHPQPEKLFSHV